MNAMPYVKIKAGREELGRLHLLGSEVGERSYTFLLKSSGLIQGFASICEGAFDSTVSMVDEDGKIGNSFIGKKLVGDDPLEVQFDRRVHFMKCFAAFLSKRVMANCASQVKK